MKLALLAAGWILFLGTMWMHGVLTSGETLTLGILNAVAYRVFEKA